ncbi:MAG: hypothetical protein ACTS43_00335 [Candidatus Hodgkinia cicadicola]
MSFRSRSIVNKNHIYIQNVTSVKLKPSEGVSASDGSTYVIRTLAIGNLLHGLRPKSAQTSVYLN